MSGIRARKAEHLELALTHDVDSERDPGWADIDLVHEALPEVDRDEIELATEWLGHRLTAPVVIAGMTGGHPDALALNRALGRAAQRHGLAIGVGSQRAAVLDPGLAPTYAAVREEAPDALVIANIGAAQLVPQRDRPALAGHQIAALVRMVEADALAVHLNVAEEAVQPEGDRRTRGCTAAIERLVELVDVPIVVKETGAGMSLSTAQRLRDIGVASIDVGGAGGTSFAAVERVRAERQGDEAGASLGRMLGAWGIPTAVAVALTVRSGLPVVATGGIRSGLDCAKALALGATCVGMARPLLQAAAAGDEHLERWITRFLGELTTVMMLTGCRTVADLRRQPLVIGGRTRRWLDDLAEQGHAHS